MTRFVTVSAVLVLVLALGAPPVGAQADTRADTRADALHIELNRLEERGAGCRVHLVLENTGPRAYASYRLDLVIFGEDGVIARRLALETAPLRANKTMVKEFELTDLACARVGRILLNDVSQCASADGDMDDCITATRVSSRGRVSFVK